MPLLFPLPLIVMHGALKIINISGTENREDKLTVVTTNNPDQRNVSRTNLHSL